MMLNNLISASLFNPNSLQQPDAWVGHLPFAAWIIQEVNPEIFVELGTHTGNSYFSFCQSVKESSLSTKCYAVDTWQGDEHAGEYGEEIFQYVSAYNQKNYSGFSRLLRMTFDDALSYFSDGSIQLLHIDGLHSYEAVKHDFETWLPKLAPGAVVLFHDSNVRERNFGVWKLWGELQQKYPNNLEFLHSHGLGVLQINEANEDKKLEWLASSSKEQQELKNYFSELGKRQLERFELVQTKIHVENLNRELSERDRHIVSLNQCIEERNGQVAKLNDAVAERDGHIAKLNDAVAERDGHITKLSDEVALRDEQIASIYLTTSWRLTKPLRGLRRLVSKKKNLITWTFIRNLCLTVRGEIRRYGFIGFSQRIPYYFRNVSKYLGLLASRSPAAYSESFDMEPIVPRDIRLHPNLYDVFEPIDASVSIVIPTLNAGPEFPWLLRKLYSQRGLCQIEIVIVDSGSTDGTVEIAREAGCKILEIQPSEFSHSYARNIGADAASGDYFLFMVQDAYPIGDQWLLGILRYLIDHSDEKLAAVSCAEYSRSDSDMMYDSMINTHYRFLGCLDYDRLGEYKGDDHISLRSFGQLSDVSCLIGRETFFRYRYRGDYAEDLDLGIRLIKDGYRVAMLASVKVIHSHNRPAYYYLKRSFVDVVFLVSMFDDFVYPSVKSSQGLIAGIVSVATHLTSWLGDTQNNDEEYLLEDKLNLWIKTWRSSFAEPQFGKHLQLGDVLLDEYIKSLASRFLLPDEEVFDVKAVHEMQHFLDAFLARLEHLNTFVSQVYGRQDDVLHKSLCDAVLKTFAATAGSALGFMYLDLAQSTNSEGEMARTISNELRAGV